MREARPELGKLVNLGGPNDREKAQQGKKGKKQASSVCLGEGTKKGTRDGDETDGENKGFH